jgi:hypothetical protein
MASRDKKEQTDFAVSPLPKKRELMSPAVADEIGGTLGSLSLDDVHKGSAPADAKLAHALYRTFDGLELDVAGRKDGSHALVAFSARSTDKATKAEAARLNARLGGWEFEIPEYKYNTIFRPLEELLKKPPEPVVKKPPHPKPPAKPPAKTSAEAGPK